MVLWRRCRIRRKKWERLQKGWMRAKSFRSIRYLQVQRASSKRKSKPFQIATFHNRSGFCFASFDLRLFLARCSINIVNLDVYLAILVAIMFGGFVLFAVKKSAWTTGFGVSMQS
ncbi:hypothetical protein MTP99_002037 [Tenebrio molitor]|nr:hypothetical protein MTP99_002037 [Tenebrio molitor]